jgi:hypothetical protein
VDVPRPEQHPDPGHERQGAADETDHHHPPRQQPGAPREIPEQDPVPEPGAELGPEERDLVVQGEE